MMAIITAAAAALLFLLLPFTSPSLTSSPNPTLQYHHGHLLSGNLTLHLIWYGHFSPSQRSTISDFLLSLSHPSTIPPPSVSSWWATTRLYYHPSSLPLSFSLSPQLLLPSYPLGRSLSSSSILSLISHDLPSSHSSIPILLTSSDVSVEGFCSSRCGTHSPLPNSSSPFIWLGDSTTRCPGLCAWPFHQPPYGPQSPPLGPPSGDIGADGMVINLATLLAGAATNPDGRGFFQGPPEAPLEAVTACTGIFGTGAYPGFPGNLLLDPTTGASYNARGLNGRKYLLPAMWDPRTSQCATLV